MNPYLLLGGAALGAIQGERQANRVASINRANAEQTRYSPWTGMGAGKIQSTGGGWFDGALQGGTAGMMLGQQFDNANQNFETGKPTTNVGLDQRYRTSNNPWSIG